MDELAFQMKSEKSVEEAAASLEKNSADSQFRVLAVHDVQATLAEKGFKREPLKIIEICNSGFAHQILEKDINVAMFMPCKFTVYREKGETIVTLMRPTMISKLLPNSHLQEEVAEVEKRLKKVMEDSL